MKKLQIIKKDNYQYLLENTDGERYIFNLEFYDIAKDPDENDYIYMADSLLDRDYQEYNSSYAFGSFGSVYGRDIRDNDNPDIVVLEIAGERTYLERYYG